MINEKPPHLFVLPNGSHLSYAFPRDKGNQFAWKKSWDIPIVRNWKSKSKQGQIKLGLWSSRSNQHVIAVDIDRLPVGYGSFDEVRRYLSAYFGERAIVAESFSGRAKAFIVVEFPQRVMCNGRLAIHCLNCILPTELFAEVDKHVSALSITYLNSDIINKLSKVSNIQPYIFNELSKTDSPNQLLINPIGNKKNEKNVLYSDSSSIGINRPFPIWDGRLPAELRALLKLEKRPVKEIVIRKLLSLRGLTTEGGFALPCTRIGRECETCHTNVSYWLRGWIEDGLLECVDDSYNFRSDRSFLNASAKAKRYRFKGAALSFAETLLTIDRNDQPEQIRIPESTTPIQDGRAYTELFTTARKLKRDPSEYWDHVLARPNINEKDRLRMAKNAIAYFCPEEKRRDIRDIRELLPRTSG